MIRQLLEVVFKDEGEALYYNKLRRFFLKNIRANIIVFLGKGGIADINLLEQRYYSQNGEDGIIKAIFNRIGTTNRFCVEFGIHSNEGNTIYLKKMKWDCLWMDGRGDGVIIKKEYITAENINQLFEKYNVPLEFDLLSIDIDSNDYWVWKAVLKYSPRVVVVEYNSSFPPTESRSIVYDPNAQWDGTNYYGASLLALHRLGESKGYTLVVCDQSGNNAFFVRNDLLGGHFKVKPIEETFKPPGFGRRVNGRRIGHPPSEREMINV